MYRFSIFRKIHPPYGRINTMPKAKLNDYQSITTLARRWLYTLQIKQSNNSLKLIKNKQNEKLSKSNRNSSNSSYSNFFFFRTGYSYSSSLCYHHHSDHY